MIVNRGEEESPSILFRDWYGTPVYAYIRGEETQEAVIISGGFRGDCMISQQAVMETLERVEVSKKAYFIPTLDPTGSRGIKYIINRFSPKCYLNDVECLRDVIGIRIDVVGDTAVILAGNLYLLYPLGREYNSVEEFVEHIKSMLPLDSLEGFLVLVSPTTGGSPARSMHVEGEDILPLDIWKGEPPGHVGLFLNWAKNVSGALLYIEAGCGERRGTKITLYEEAAPSLLRDIAELAAAQVEDSRIEVVGMPRGGSIHGELVKMSLPVIKVEGGDVETLTTVLLSLLNSFAFFSV